MPGCAVANCHWLTAAAAASPKPKPVGSDDALTTAEDTPLLIAYDETACAKGLFYEHEDPARVCRMFEDQRRSMAAVLRRLPEGAFARCGVHNQRGKVTLREFVQIYVDHVRGHMEHLLRKRELLGKALTIAVP